MNILNCPSHIFLYLLLKLILVQSNDSINLASYYKMPPLYMYQDYDRCLKESPSRLSVYCLSVSQVVPNNNSELWNQIDEFNKDVMRHYRHDILIYGHCVNWCENDLKKIVSTRRDELYVGLLSNKSMNDFFEKYHPNESENRIKYNKIINQCINHNFKTKYDLMVTTNIRYCVSNQDSIEIDVYDIVFVLLIVFIIGLVASSTYYDLKLKLKRPPSEQTNEHYKESIKGNHQSILLSFSICRNYYRLLKPSTMKYARDIRFIDAFRVVMILAVVANHSIQLTLVSGVQNTEHIETFMHRFDKIILCNSNGLMATFFSLSGFILYLTVKEKISKKPKENIQYWSMVTEMIFSRYTRFTSLLAIIIFFNSTLLVKLSEGPIWRIATQKEQISCRQNWWINILYLQNYINAENACLPQLWYIAVDFQLYIMSLILVVFCFKHPKSTKTFLSVSTCIGALIAAYVTYSNNFTGTYLHKPEFFRHFTYFNRDFVDYYIPGHMNINGYICGICLAIIYLKLREEKSKIGENKFFQFLCYFSIVLGFVLIFSGEIFYRYKVPRILSALYAAMYKLLYPIFWGVFMIGLTQKIGGLAYEFCCLPHFRFLSRLSYSVLVMQFPVLITIFSYVREPFYANDFAMIVRALGYIILTYIVSFFTTLCVECPVTNLTNAFLDRKKKNNRKIDDDSIPFQDITK